jgi:nucleoside-diphosphate-sugar epimerase
MKLLVTAGAGSIGSHLMDRLIADGHNVCVVNNFSTGIVKNLPGVLGANKRCRFQCTCLASYQSHVFCGFSEC